MGVDDGTSFSEKWSGDIINIELAAALVLDFLSHAERLLPLISAILASVPDLDLDMHNIGTQLWYNLITSPA